MFQEILPFSAISAIPDTLPNILGGVTLRERTMTVVDLSAVMWAMRPPDEVTEKKFILFGCSGEHFVLLVEKVDHIFSCSQDHFHTPSQKAGNHILIQGAIESKLILIQAIDMSNLLRLFIK